MRESSNELYVGTDKGIFKTRSIKRVLEPDRYHCGTLEKMVRIPLKMIPNAESDVINTLPAIVDMPPSVGDSGKTPALLRQALGHPRQAYINKGQLQNVGCVRNCP